MDELDAKIQKIMKGKIQEPIEYEQKILNAIRNTKNQKRKGSYSIKKRIIATACASLVLVSGVVLAGKFTYDNIWKEPIPVDIEKTTWEALENPSSELYETELKDFITESKAISIAQDVIKTLHGEEMELKQVTLIKESDIISSYYELNTSADVNRGIHIKINALNGNFIHYDNLDVYKYKQDDITEDEAIRRANEICSKMNIIGANENYEVMEAKQFEITTTGKIHKVWGVSYANKYNNIYDKTNYFTIAFIISNGKTIPYSINGNIKKSNFENNLVEISKENAIEVAVNKEKEFSDYEIINVDAELSIEKMNVFVYCMENNLTDMSGLKIEERTRNVWLVTINHHPKNEIIKDLYNDKELIIDVFKQKANKKYYIDATTGEIIGGEQAEY